MMTRICIFLTLFVGLTGCLEKEQPGLEIPHSERPFGLFVIHLTLIDYDTKAPVPGLSVKVLNTNALLLNDEERLSNESGTIRVPIIAAPPVPQEFILSCVDVDNNRLFSYDNIVVRFSNPVFVYNPQDALALGKPKWYQGTTELTLISELRRIVYE
jgi:hypothetical protein